MASRVLDVAFKSQNDPDAGSVYNDCGPCCVAMILGTQGQNVATSDVYAASGVQADRALTFGEVSRAAGQYGLPLAWRLDATPDDVRAWIDQGTPVIALVKYHYLPDRQGLSSTGGHYVLVVGYDDDAGELVINDPYYWGPLRSKGDHHHYDNATWEAAWGRCHEDSNPDHSILIPQISRPVPSIAHYVRREPLPSVVTLYTLPAVDAYNGLKLRSVRDTAVSGPAVFSRRPLTVVGGPVTEGDATWYLVRTQAADDMAGWACARRGDEAYLGDKPEAEEATAAGPVTAQARPAFVQPDVEKYGGLKLRAMRDVRLSGPLAHTGAAVSIVADPVGAGDNEWWLVTLQDGQDTAGWVRVRQGAETYVGSAPSVDIVAAPITPAQPSLAGEVWAIAPAGLMLRPQPSSPLDKSMASLAFGTHLAVVSPESDPDEKGRTWIQVRTDGGMVGWVPASAGGDRLVADTQPGAPYQAPVLDTPPVRQAGGLRVRDSRDIDSEEVDKARIGELLMVYVRAVEEDGTPWLWVRSPRGRFGWAREKSGDVTLVGRPGPVEEGQPAKGHVVPIDRPGGGKCLAGVGLANPHLLEEADLDALRQSRVEAVKLLTLPNAEQSVEVLNQIRALYPNAFIVARLMAQFGTRIDPPLFVEMVGDSAVALYQAGVRYFEVHNEPNLPQEGQGVSWADGAEFGAWFSQAVHLLRARLPDARLGYPGLSPQEVNHPTFPFLDGSAQAINTSADWIGVHCYWQSDGNGHWQMRSDDYGGMFWRRVAQRFPGKLLMITEFSCNNRQVAYADKGRMYGDYYRLLRHEPQVGAALAFALNWPDQDNNREGWVFNWGVTAIPGTVGALIAQLD